MHSQFCMTSPSLDFTTHMYPSIPHQNLHLFNSFRFTSLHFIPFIFFTTRFLKFLVLLERVLKESTGSWFQNCMALFTKEYFLTYVHCFLLLIFLSLSTLLR
jgi:hypothetical protein